MKKKLLCILLITTLILSFKLKGQFIGSSYEQQTKSVIIYSVATSAVIAGVGAVINKNEKQKWSAAFLKGFIYGGLGGYLMYQGKNMLNNVTTKEDISYYWPAKLVFSAGESISENAASNMKPWTRWHVNLWLSTRLYVDLQDKLSISAKVDPIQIIYTSIEFFKFKGREFDLKRSFKSGLICFNSKGKLSVGGTEADGYAGPGFIVVDNEEIDNRYTDIAMRNKYRHQVYAHEMVHTFQFNSFSTFIGYVGNSEDIREAKGVYVNPGILLQSILYRLEGNHDGNQYYRNFYEFEAQYFATKQKVNIQ